jgi:hypothetical protein
LLDCTSSQRQERGKDESKKRKRKAMAAILLQERATIRSSSLTK